MQGYQSLTLVASQLFGEGGSEAAPEAEVPKTAEELQASFAQVFGTG